MKLSTPQRSFINALGTVVYTAAIAWFLSHASTFFHKEDTFLVPMFMMLLLIISATITGSLVLGKPIQLYLSDQKSAAITMLWQTLVWVIIFAVIVGITLR